MSSPSTDGAAAREPLSAILGVALGGAVGTLVRYLVGLSLSSMQLAFPLGTLLVNLVGCFVIGAVMFLALERRVVPPVLRATLATGFCGGLTTFSSFALETFRLFEGHLGLALLNLGLQLGLGLAAVRVGAALSAKFVPDPGGEP